MKQYYLHNGTEQQGPFTIDELKAKSIAKESAIWYEGLAEWTTAGNVDELKEFFKIPTPPPFVAKATVHTPPPITNEKKPETNHLINSSSDVKAEQKKSKRKIVYVVIGIVILIAVLIGGWLIYTNQQLKQTEIQRQLDAQQSKIKEQESIEAQRLLDEQLRQSALAEQERAEKLQSLKIEYDNAITGLRVANERLNEIRQFKALRTRAEKDNQIRAQLENIRAWENEVNRLKSEIDNF